MFLESSRYYKVRQELHKTSDGRTFKAVTLRRLPTLTGTLKVVKEHDRLDIMAQRQYANGTMFWRIADANTELRSNNLVEEPGRSINVPES